MGKTNVTRCRVLNRPYFRGRPCAGGCGKTFVPTDKVVILDVPTNDFRGDDEVYSYCPACYEEGKASGREK